MSEPPSNLPDWDRLGFGAVETDTLFHVHGETGRDPIWGVGEYRPWGPVTLSPAAAFLSYGLGVFEGLKAHRTADDRILVFRARDHGRRFGRSAERFLMAPFPEERFVEVVTEVVRRNARFVPPTGKGTFYVRPMQHAVEPKIGIRPCSAFHVIVIGCPVGEYFADRSEGVRLRVLEQGRCAPGGTGAAKAMGNYAGGIAIAEAWKDRGFDDVLYLDARHLRDVTETSGSNVFCKMSDGTLVTPALNDQILAGITRDSVLRIAAEGLGVRTVERDIPVEELLDDAREVFCTGTAWTVRQVREIEHRDRTKRFESSELQSELLAWLREVQRGEREDRFGWTTEVRP